MARPILLLLALLALTVALPAPHGYGRARASADGSPTYRWVAAWEAAPQGPFPDGHTFDQPPLGAVFRDGMAADQTLRLVVRPTAGGSLVRIRLSNLVGRRPLLVGAAYIGVRAAGAALVPGSNRRLTFDDRATVALRPGAEEESDPVALDVVAGRQFAVSLYIPPGDDTSITWHASAFTTSYSTGQGMGDHAADEAGAAFAYRTTSWFWLDGLDVYSPEAGAVVTLGDSITDGWVSTVDGDDRWPDILARRLLRLRLPPDRRLSVVDAGIAGNMLEPPPAACLECGPPAVARLDRDVLAQPGARAVIVFEGTNDIGHGAGAARVIAGLRAIAARARARGLAVYGATLLPDGGSGFMTPRACLCDPFSRERARDRVNAFIRTSGIFDAVFDFDALLRDPRDRWRLDPRYDSGDHLHPNAAGLRVIGDAIPLPLIERSAARRTRAPA